MRMTIAVLEDNEDRIRTMSDRLADKFPFFQRQFFRSAPEAIEWLDRHLATTICLALDHDLEPAADGSPSYDPGTGRDVADFLVQRRPQCPVVVHTTNVPAGIGMELALAEAGWSVTRITPYSDLQWIDEAWLPLVREAIAQLPPTTPTV